MNASAMDRVVRTTFGYNTVNKDYALWVYPVYSHDTIKPVTDQAEMPLVNRAGEQFLGNSQSMHQGRAS